MKTLYCLFVSVILFCTPVAYSFSSHGHGHRSHSYDKQVEYENYLTGKVSVVCVGEVDVDYNIDIFQKIRGRIAPDLGDMKLSYAKELIGNIHLVGLPEKVTKKKLFLIEVEVVKVPKSNDDLDLVEKLKSGEYLPYSKGLHDKIREDKISQLNLRGVNMYEAVQIPKEAFGEKIGWRITLGLEKSVREVDGRSVMDTVEINGPCIVFYKDSVNEGYAYGTSHTVLTDI